MRRLRWLTASAISAVQGELIAHYGGLAGVRDVAVLESAVARAKHLATYQEGITVLELAACYAWGLIRNHPFLDGNKRVALAAAVIFLDVNGWELTCSEAAETALVLSAAAGQITESAFTDWIGRNARRK